MSEISFEYFDPEIELGTIDEHGKPIRPRKKPGRKPNPPSPSQRKAQNRAAQRAFRERKRREMREAENNIKKCINQRDQAIRRANTLQKSVKQLQYQCNYLRGMVLTLKLACFSHGINVPKFWNTGDIDAFGSDITSLSKTKGIPQNLEFFLDNKLHIINQSPEVIPSDNNTTMFMNQQQSSSSSSSSSNLTSGSSNFLTRRDNSSPSLYTPTMPDFITQVLSNQQQGYDHSMDQQQQLFNLFDTSPKPTYWSSSPSPSTPTNLSTSSFISVNNNNNNNNNNNSNSLSPSSSSSIHHHTSINNHNNQLQLTSSSSSSTITPLIQLSSSSSTTSSSSSTHNLHDHNNRQIFPPMPAIDAVNYIRNINSGKPFHQTVYTPTELQRHVPHDARIDYVPGPLMRDHMIMFQGYYDANALFSFLINQSVFLGGDLGNPDCWFVPPSFFQTYWFLMPNHRPRRVDNAIEIAVNQGRTLSRMMFPRKKMYLQREKYADYFPPIKNDLDDDIQLDDDDDIDIEDDDIEDDNVEDNNNNNNNNNNNQQQHQKKEKKDHPILYDDQDDSISDNEIKMNHDPWTNTAINNNKELHDDVSLNAVMNLMETLPRLTTPNVFNF